MFNRLTHRLRRAVERPGRSHGALQVKRAASVLWLGCLLACAAAQAADWQPIVPGELQMTAEPKAPGANAIFLYRQIDRDDAESNLKVYERIKILTEEGRSRANIELTYDRRSEGIYSIDARTIRPDGTIVAFDGQIFEKPIIKGRDVRLHAKTFTLPEVQVGSIIEYRYTHRLSSRYVFDSYWDLSTSLFTKRAKFALTPSPWFSMTYSWPGGLPPNTQPPKRVGEVIRLETGDVPAFVEEDFMLPERDVKYHVDFVYTDGPPQKNPDDYWRSRGKTIFRKVETFVNKRKAMEQAVAQIVAAGDSSEAKLRKIYARAQQLRNTSFERNKTAQELQREQQEEANDAADIWARGYGDAEQVTLLFVGLARAAGFDAQPVLVSSRDRYIFRKETMNPWQLNTFVAAVNLEGKEVFLDPGMPYASFAMLPWSETGVIGLKLDKKGGTWVTTPSLKPGDSMIDRKAKLQLLDSGALEGKVTVTYTGIEALRRRIEMRDEDETERKEFLEEQIKFDVPSGVDVAVTNTPEWESAEKPLVVEYDLTVPGWIAGAGQRALMRVGVFGRRESNVFKHATRLHHLYFSYPYRTADEIEIEMPKEWRVDTVPSELKLDKKFFSYGAAAAVADGKLQLKREFVLNALFLDRKYYDQVRAFFQEVRTGDEGQIVIGLAAKAKSK